MKARYFAHTALIASAFVLAGLLAITVADRHPITPAADAAMVVNKDIFTVMTAPGISNEEFLYILDNRNERLLCYAYNPRGQIELYASMHVGEIITRGLTAAAGQNPGGR